MDRKELHEKWEPYPFCEIKCEEFKSDLNAVIDDACKRQRLNCMRRAEDVITAHFDSVPEHKKTILYEAILVEPEDT